MVRRFEFVAHMATAQQRQPLFRHRGSCDVAAYSFQFLALVRSGCNTRVQRESRHLADMGNERLMLSGRVCRPRVRAFSHEGCAFMLSGETYRDAIRGRSRHPASRGIRTSVYIIEWPKS